jgi:hypothetical protein
MAVILVPRTSFAHPAVLAGAHRLGLAVGAVRRGLDRVLATVLPDAHREPQTAAELIEWARSYEQSQPSYAADLRAAALAVQAREATDEAVRH